MYTDLCSYFGWKGAGEENHWLRELAALPEDLCLVPNTHIRWRTARTIENLMLSGLHEHTSTWAHTSTQTHAHRHTHN